MPQETDPTLLEGLLVLLRWLGITTLGGSLGLLPLLYYLRPRLTITDVKDKHPKHNFESRFIIRNIGQFPALQVWANVHDLNAVVGPFRIKGSTSIHCGQVISRIDHNESVEVPALPHAGLPPGMTIEACRYILETEHLFKLLFYRTVIKRRWSIELRNLPDGSFTWQFSAL
jgi:hypothetical protein